jgi:hypothetical protein
MKLFLSIALAVVPVVATGAIVFVSYAEGGVRFVRPDKSGVVAFGIVLIGAMLQGAKEIGDWRTERQGKELAEKAKQEADMRAVRGLERLCNTVNFMLG